MGCFSAVSQMVLTTRSRQIDLTLAFPETRFIRCRFFGKAVMTGFSLDVVRVVGVRTSEWSSASVALYVAGWFERMINGYALIEHEAIALPQGIFWPDVL